MVVEALPCREVVECGEKTPYQDFRTVRCTRKAVCFIQHREQPGVCVALCDAHTIFPANVWRRIPEGEFILVQVMGA